MSLLQLPNELLLQVGEHLQFSIHVSRLSRTNRRLHSLLQNLVFWCNVRYSWSSALLWASEHGREDVVGRLLEAGANVQVLNRRRDQTSLTLAVREGHTTIVKQLLAATKIIPDWSDKIRRRTSLSIAAELGRHDVVELLLARDDVDLNTTCSHSRTPLSYASEQGHEQVVKLLLARDDLNLAEGFPTPLDYAAEKGHLRIVQILLATGRVDPNLGSSTTTPIERAARYGHTSIVTVLLDCPKVEPDGFGGHWRSPLSHAAGNGHLDTVKVFLSRADVNPDSRDQHGRSPLSYAAENGHPEVVELLLICPTVDPDSRDKEQRTPLLWATTHAADEECDNLFQGRRLREQTRTEEEAGGRDEKIVYSMCNALLTRGANGSAEDDQGWTPLKYCIKLDRPALIQLLLSRCKLSVPKSDDNEFHYSTPLADREFPERNDHFPPELHRLLRY